ncbi:hypothetical protein INT45_007140 [Circinella minor]|uniref:Heme haloperoxidase family profile domain-containing protein n=1 Tax=Circinella minor TaxID=1195481 RepID=A0A8H7S2Y3_9FUNG|nr:hypothetical protein INT45_007140 [Circinella minor]
MNEKYGTLPSSSSSSTTNTIVTNGRKPSSVKKSFKLLAKLGLIGLSIYLTFQMFSIQQHASQFQPKNQEEWSKIIKEHPYAPPSANDLRGPCPALNTLANHGFLPRDGRNITQKQLFESVITLGTPTFVAHFISKAPFSKFKKQHPSDTVMSYLRPLKMVDLKQFGIHNAVEHDVSLSRCDTNVPPFDANRFIPERFERMIQLAKKRQEEQENHVKGLNENIRDQGSQEMLVVSSKDVNDHRKLCWLESIRDNPFFSMGTSQQIPIAGESAALLEILGQDSAIQEDHLRSFFIDEKIPDNWQPHPPATLKLIKQMWQSFKGVQQSNATLPKDEDKSD